MEKSDQKNNEFSKKFKKTVAASRREKSRRKNAGQKLAKFLANFCQKPRLSTLFGQKVTIFEAEVISKKTKKAPETGFLVKNTVKTVKKHKNPVSGALLAPKGPKEIPARRAGI